MCVFGGSPRGTTSERTNTNQSSANQSGELSSAMAGRQFWSRPRQVDTNKKTRGQICGGNGAETGGVVFSRCPHLFIYDFCTCFLPNLSNSSDYSIRPPLVIYCKDSDSKQLVFQTQCQRDGEDDACNLLQVSMQVSFETLIGALHQSCMWLTTSRGSNGAGAAMSTDSWMNPKKKVLLQ